MGGAPEQRAIKLAARQRPGIGQVGFGDAAGVVGKVDRGGRAQNWWSGFSDRQPCSAREQTTARGLPVFTKATFIVVPYDTQYAT
jgi:hypothetical protein